MKKIPSSAALDLDKLRLAIVVSKFNSEITDKLLSGALETIKNNNIPDDNLLLVEVPGAYELPMVCRKLAKKGDYDAIIALGAVIRGDTYHYELVCQAASEGILNASIKTGVPVIFGVITTENEQQAYDRSGGKEGNKGSDAVDAALQMIKVVREIDNVE